MEECLRSVSIRLRCSPLPPRPGSGTSSPSRRRPRPETGMRSPARESLRGVETVILDEVHALAGTKRGGHLALSLERLEHLVADGAQPPSAVRPLQRIGLSATVRPPERVARFLGGPHPVRLVTP